MAPGDVIILSKRERLSWRGHSRPGNSGMGHTCRCSRRPFEAKVCDVYVAGPRVFHVCLKCARKIAKKHGKDLPMVV